MRGLATSLAGSYGQEARQVNEPPRPSQTPEEHEQQILQRLSALPPEIRNRLAQTYPQLRQLIVRAGGGAPGGAGPQPGTPVGAGPQGVQAAPRQAARPGAGLQSAPAGGTTQSSPSTGFTPSSPSGGGGSTSPTRTTIDRNNLPWSPNYEPQTSGGATGNTKGAQINIGSGKLDLIRSWSDPQSGAY